MKSEDSSLVTGQIIRLDHGYSIQSYWIGLFDFYDGNGFGQV